MAEATTDFGRSLPSGAAHPQRYTQIIIRALTAS